MKRETLLLVSGGAFIAANQGGLILALDRPWGDLWIVGMWLACVVVGVRVLNRLIPQRDPFIFPATMLLTGWGLNLVDRLLPSYTLRQVIWMVLGTGLLLIICALPGHLRWLRGYRYTWLLGGLALLGITILLGTNPSGTGPQLWLGFGEFFFQPSEPLKVLLVAFLASYMADHQVVFHSGEFQMGRPFPSWRFFAPLLLMWGMCLGLLIWQRDLGTAAIFFLAFLLMLYAASGRVLLLMGGMVLLGLAGLGAYRLLDVVALRVDIWLDPWRDADNTSFQIVQSLMAIADGGLIGSGIGQGIPTFIPVVHTDFAYAAIVEEWGLLGALGVIAALLVIILRGLRMAALLQDKPFHAYLALGLSLLLGVQSLIIIAGTLNLIPLTGVTLPFVSYGGSSLVTSFGAVGLLLALSREVPDPK
jgi:cell division protein FtsW